MVLGKFPFFPPHPVPIATFLSRELFLLSHLFQNSFSKFDDFEDFERVEKLIFAPRIDHVNRVTILTDINRKSIGESSNGGEGGSKTFQVGVAVSSLIRILDERNRKQTKAGSAVEGPPPFLLLDASSTPSRWPRLSPPARARRREPRWKLWKSALRINLSLLLPKNPFLPLPRFGRLSTPLDLPSTPPFRSLQARLGSRLLPPTRAAL